jgi:alpha-beta hydrolase superfamily lysophospholipase
MNIKSIQSGSVVIYILSILFGCSRANNTSMATRDFEFVSDNKKLSGIIDQPLDREAEAIIIFVHGSGNTDIRKENRYFDLRSRFTPMGITCVTWDKPGQGKSEGIFDDNQPLEQSAQEVLDAIEWLRSEKVSGFKKIGIWATSRGGWVAPIALSQDDSIRFWISVSGVPAADNKYYLMKSNLPLEGRTHEETETLMNEWKRGREIFFSGGNYESYLAETENLRKDSAVFYFAGDLTGTKDAFDGEQKAYLRHKEKYQFDENLSIIRVPNFARMLSNLDMPVLALFGKKDTNVNWRDAKALYQATIGENRKATLTIQVFPNCNHSMSVSATGSVREVEGTALDAGIKCKGYYDLQIGWLKKYVLSK